MSCLLIIYIFCLFNLLSLFILFVSLFIVCNLLFSPLFFERKLQNKDFFVPKYRCQIKICNLESAFKLKIIRGKKGRERHYRETLFTHTDTNTSVNVCLLLQYKVTNMLREKCTRFFSTIEEVEHVMWVRARVCVYLCERSLSSVVVSDAIVNEVLSSESSVWCTGEGCFMPHLLPLIAAPMMLLLPSEQSAHETRLSASSPTAVTIETEIETPWMIQQSFSIII